ncbi:MAG TPA: glycosyltransferase [Mycobacteriales bacterium]|nr:glycosyltransferase [Mycobacteriales bacterium]
MKVAHYLERWLELSAGFIAAQVERSRHDGYVVSRDGWVNREAFPVTHGSSLHRLRDAAPERLKYAALRGQLQPLLLARRIDLVHVHFGYAAKDVLDVTRHRPFVLSLHGHDVTGLVTEQPGCYAGVPAAVDAVIVPSRFLATAAERAGFDPETMRVIPSGVDTSYFTPTPIPDGPPIVAFIGRLVEKKGLDVLLEAWQLVRAEFRGATLVVLGDGALSHLLDDRDDTVRHLKPDPSRRHEQVRDLIRSAQLVVSPSRTAANGDSESLLLVNLEAGASARPVVTTRHGGIPEYVEDDRNGMLVAENDARQLAAMIVYVLDQPSVAARLAQAGVEQAARWDVRRCAALVDDLYDELADRPRK